MHYDNPMLHTGTCNNNMPDFIYLVSLGKVDSSGLNLYYSFTPTKIKAGNIAIGSSAFPHMIIPPNAETFTHESLCSSTCLDRVCTLIIELIQYNVIISYIFSSIFLMMVFIFLPLFYIHILLVCN